MLLDAVDIDSGTLITADLCIIGAGPAGCAIAEAFRNSPLTVLLLESGGLTSEAASQALNEGRYVGNVPAVDAGYLRRSRLREYGGTTNFWGGYSRPLEPADFEQRDWVANSGWPLTFADLDPYFRRTSAFLGFDVFGDKPLMPDEPAYAPHFDGGPFYSPLYQFRYINIGGNHLAGFKASTRIRLVVHASAVNLALSAGGGAIDHVDLATLGGKRFKAKARAYVLATGGIENARLLLASQSVQPTGVGNEHDLVGRFFMEHLVIPVGLSHPAYVWQSVSLSRYRPSRPVGSTVPQNDNQVACLVSLSESVLQERRLLSMAADLTYAVPPDHFEFSELEMALIRATHDLDLQCGPDQLPPQAVNAGFVCENAPNPASRVQLSEDRDVLGVPRVRLDWRIGALELSTIETFLDLFAAELGRKRLGRMRIPPLEDVRSRIVGGHHHMGTTRMHVDPRQGVVDVNCRVHGVNNLFVAGSSVFPTAGAANPTFTLLALALRLADHLRGRLS
jgi:choline dehydrogenase-like flavoprotein